MGPLVGDEGEARVGAPGVRREADVRVGQVGRVVHDVGREGARIAGGVDQGAVVGREHIGHAAALGRFVRAVPEAGRNLLPDLADRRSPAQQFAEAHDLRDDGRGALGIETRRFEGVWVVPVDDAGEAVRALPDQRIPVFPVGEHAGIGAQVLRCGAQGEVDLAGLGEYRGRSGRGDLGGQWRHRTAQGEEEGGKSTSFHRAFGFGWRETGYGRKVRGPVVRR